MRGYSFTTTEEREIGRGVKEKLCYIVSHHDTELKSTAKYSTKCDADIRNNLYANVVLSSGTTMSREIVERMTNGLTTLAPSTMKKIKDELPDENIRTVGAERFRCVEVLFQLDSTGKEASGFHDTSLLRKCDVDIRKDLCANVLSSSWRPCSKGLVSTCRRN